MHSLWLIDNESALLHSYRILYDSKKSHRRDKYRGTIISEIHQMYLKTNCVFRRKTVRRLYALVKSPDPSQLLLR